MSPVLLAVEVLLIGELIWASYAAHFAPGRLYSGSLLAHGRRAPGTLASQLPSMLFTFEMLFVGELVRAMNLTDLAKGGSRTHLRCPQCVGTRIIHCFYLPLVFLAIHVLSKCDVVGTRNVAHSTMIHLRDAVIPGAQSGDLPPMPFAIHVLII